MRTPPKALAVALVLVATAARGQGEASPAMADAAARALQQATESVDWDTTEPLRLQLPDVARAWRFNDLVMVGDEAPTPAAMDALRDLGVGTLVSIDAKEPDVFLAASRGMDYVHAPVALGEPDPAQVLTALSVMTWMKGPYYFHAGPEEARAMWVAAIATAMSEHRGPSRAAFVLERAGFPHDERRLWLELIAPNGFDLDFDRVRALPPDFHEMRPPTTTRGWMYQVLRSFVVLRESEAAGWRTPESFRRMDAETAARDMSETFARWAALGAPNPEEWNPRLEQAGARARELSEALRRGDTAAADGAWGSLRATCAECHAAYRDANGAMPR